MMGFGTSLFCFYSVLALTTFATAEPDYQRVITLHNQIVTDRASTGLEGLNKRINELLGGSGNGISDTPATPVQAANMVHVLIREALVAKYTEEQFATDVLKVYREGKLKNPSALNHLKSVLIIYIAAHLDKGLSEDQRIKLTHQNLDKYKLGIPFSEELVKGELNRVGFFRLYNFFVKHPGAVKVMDVPLKPDEALDYDRISTPSPPSSSSSTPTVLSPSPSANAVTTASPSSDAPDAPSLDTPTAPPISLSHSTLLTPPPKNTPSSRRVSGNLANKVADLEQHSSSPSSSSSDDDLSYVQPYLEHIPSKLDKLRKLEAEVQSNKSQLEQLKQESAALKGKMISEHIGLDASSLTSEASSITHLTKYLSELTVPVDPGPPLPEFETREAKIAKLEGEKTNGQTILEAAKTELQNPTVTGTKKFLRNQELEQIKKENGTKIIALVKDINALKNINSVEYKALEKQKKQYDLELESYTERVLKFQEDTKKKNTKPDLIRLLNMYKALLETEEKYKTSDISFKTVKRDLKIWVDKSKDDPLPAQEIYKQDSRFQEAARLVDMWNKESAVAAKVNLDLSRITANRSGVSGSAKQPESAKKNLSGGNSSGLSASNSAPAALAVSRNLSIPTTPPDITIPTKKLFTPPKLKNGTAPPQPPPSKSKRKPDSDEEDDD
ncbi:hypothetical protein [Candidatus Finniella inopinata]|uniref:Uncharacterized protein n=1 Tax=Candidatus Finniella inopinata TaxID=1696036 RepID=A0A4Q7DJX9_9PROT|nr:hypothetical protein [Candidatus Finniella inopinata]RZI46668.1 hypothetical protein EQU50_03535 [Candidatus Finniella inopinata]